MTGKIYLIPSIISPDTQQQVLPQYLMEIILGTDYFLVENIRTSRRFISSLNLGIDISSLTFEELDKNTSAEKIKELLDPVLSGKNVGVMSEAGCPGIADPGAKFVALAHEQNVEIVPLVGPSSIFLALMASGFNGQSFSFHGYLPIEKKQREKQIRLLEEKANQGSAQLFMDTPYRNQQLFQHIIKVCHPSTQLCIARGVTGTSEFIKTRSIAVWSKHAPNLHKIPTIFILG